MIKDHTNEKARDKKTLLMNQQGIGRNDNEWYRIKKKEKKVNGTSRKKTSE